MRDRSRDFTYQKNLTSLGRYLRELRTTYALSGNQLAKNLYWPQSKVSRIETGKQFPSESDIKAWMTALSCPKATEESALSLLEQAKAEYRSWQDSFAIAGGAGAKQRQILELESRAKVISDFDPLFLSGLLQTTEYTSELLRMPLGPAAFGATEDEIRQMVCARVQRQQVLYDSSKMIRITLHEAALRIRVTQLATQIGQLDRLTLLATLPSLDLRIVPFSVKLPIFPFGGYTVYDSSLVILETLTGEQQLSLPEDVAMYEDAFNLVSSVALRGSDAISLMRDVIREMTRAPH